jgi:7,8-dihydropterin-6-yl-methyl-4-(beta-D-ribofuranosyl)aminobenzene 5'-phosphate synthase
MAVLMVILYLIIAIIFSGAILIALKLFQLRSGKEKASEMQSLMHIQKIKSMGAVQKLTLMPLIDFYADNQGLKTEAGVSYLLQADEKTILFDTGYNKKKEHPSPFLHNFRALGYSEKEIDLIFISHLHYDHVGGVQEEKEGSFSLSQGTVELPNIPVYTPVAMQPSKWNPGPEVNVINEPFVIGKGIASIGVIPRYLFLLGLTLEHSLAINVAGKGIVLIIGCGHQGMENIIERTKLLFDEPLYGIIGGFHYPVNGGRMNIGPFNMQQIVATDDPPWCGMNEERVHKAVAAIKETGAKKIALSAHDSSDWCLELFQKTFGDRYIPLKAGAEIII